MPRKKNNSPYFPFDANSRNKLKIVEMRMKLGIAAYGVYVMLLERLRQAQDYKEEYKLVPLSFAIGAEEKLVKSVIEDYGLFELIDGGTMYHCPEITEAMEYMEEQRQKRAESARRAAEARWGKRQQEELPSETEDIFPPFEEVEPEPAVEKKESRVLAELCEAVKDRQWIAALYRAYKVSQKTMNDLAREFIRSCECEGKQCHESIADCKKHFSRWLAKRMEARQAAPGSRSGKAVTSTEERLRREQRERDREAAERREKYDRMEREKAAPPAWVQERINGKAPSEPSGGNPAGHHINDQQRHAEMSPEPSASKGVAKEKATA